MNRAACLVDVDVVREDIEAATLRHRVARVDGEIQQHLLDLPRIGANMADVGRQLHDHFDMFADEAPQALSFVILAGTVMLGSRNGRLQQLLPVKTRAAGG